MYRFYLSMLYIIGICHLITALLTIISTIAIAIFGIIKTLTALGTVSSAISLTMHTISLTGLTGNRLASCRLTFLTGLTSLADLTIITITTVIHILCIAIQCSNSFSEFRYMDGFSLKTCSLCNLFCIGKYRLYDFPISHDHHQRDACRILQMPV